MARRISMTRKCNSSSKPWRQSTRSTFNDEPGSGPHISELSLSGKFFRNAGERETIVECSDFSLFRLWLQTKSGAGDVRNERIRLGFNTFRVWLLNTSVVGEKYEGGIHPRQYSYAQVREFAEWIGTGVEFTIFTQTQTLMPSKSDQQRHLDSVADAVRGLGNVLLELVNENDQHDNAVAVGLRKPQGVIVSSGSNGADSDTVTPVWDYGHYHTNDLSEFQRKVGHNAMEIANHYDVPVISNENTRYMDREQSETRAYDAAQNGALLCAGSCFHSVAGKYSFQFSDGEARAAAAWIAGARSIPLEFQDGQYLHRQELEGTEYIRVHSRRLADGRECFSKVRP